MALSTRRGAARALGIDLGGTNVTFALVSHDGAIVHREQRSVPDATSPEDFVGRLAELAERFLTDRGVASGELVGAGIGMPGKIDTAGGRCLFAPNLPPRPWHEVQVAVAFEERLRLPFQVFNDVNAAALGEFWFGAGRGKSSVLMLTLGTGIGGGIILDGHLIEGANHVAGEIGHVTVDPEGPLCGCGNHGCLEALAAKRGIVACALRLLAAGTPSVLPDLVGGDLTRIEPKTVYEAATQGDLLSLEVWRETGRWIGIALEGAMMLLDPAVIVIGGRIAGAGDFLFGPIREEVGRRTPNMQFDVGQIVPAQLGSNAGVIGTAAALMRAAGIEL